MKSQVLVQQNLPIICRTFALLGPGAHDVSILLNYFFAAGPSLRSALLPHEVSITYTYF
jgi:hypothetical protein